MCAARRFSCPSFFHPSTNRRMYKLLNNGVDPHRDHRWDFSCCVWSTLPTCRRQYPGRSDGNLFARAIPFASAFPRTGAVGSCIVGFGACSAFAHLTACTLAKSPSDSLHQRLQQFRCLHYCSDCYRVERTSSRAGLTPAVGHRVFTTHPVTRLIGTYTKSMR